MGLAGSIEFFARVFIAVGFLVGYAAFVASGQMAVAHFPNGFRSILNTGERAVFYCFVFLYVASQGAVTWGVDSIFKKPKGGP